MRFFESEAESAAGSADLFWSGADSSVAVGSGAGEVEGVDVEVGADCASCSAGSNARVGTIEILGPFLGSHNAPSQPLGGLSPLTTEWKAGLLKPDNACVRA